MVITLKSAIRSKALFKTFHLQLCFSASESHPLLHSNILMPNSPEGQRVILRKVLAEASLVFVLLWTDLHESIPRFYLTNLEDVKKFRPVFP